MTQFSSSLFYSHIRDRPRGGTFRCIFHYLNSVIFPRHLPSNIVKAIALFLKICILLYTLCLIFCLFVWSVWIKPLPLICKLGFHFGLCFLFVCFVFLSYIWCSSSGGDFCCSLYICTLKKFQIKILHCNYFIEGNSF